MRNYLLCLIVILAVFVTGSKCTCAAEGSRSGKALTDAFNRFDRNGDGKIARDEFSGQAFEKIDHFIEAGIP